MSITALLQARVSEAQLQGEANCASLQTRLDKSAATMQSVAGEHQELSRQRKALDRKLVRAKLLHPLAHASGLAAGCWHSTQCGVKLVAYCNATVRSKLTDLL